MLYNTSGCERRQMLQVMLIGFAENEAQNVYCEIVKHCNDTVAMSPTPNFLRLCWKAHFDRKTQFATTAKKQNKKKIITVITNKKNG